ncbi:hypothetical protein JR316_0008494 [Psilocybe cubensis]|uniref:Uncharacterized protein n=1 Tax=Psilocybe cubensis TaxID=181762 RepID=A0ACB8GVY5_PSICU|nr:hypothetical protein JR316_0008494 [Psilocybe cubensis]KAH9479898.1 hypothetical protein JR316_0008494 [Psilocybe cubensis]
MDIGMLLDMENFTGSISPAVHSSASITSLNSNENISARALEVPRTPRAHLLSMTNINEPLNHSQWDNQIQPMKQWSQFGQYQYASPQGMKTISPLNPSCSTPASLRQDTVSCTTTRSSFPANTGIYDGKSQFSSPAQSREDIQWQMYLTASLSNPLNTLEFAESHSSPMLYPSDMQGQGGIAPSFQIDSSLFPQPNSLAFPSSQNTDIFNSIPFIDSPPRISAGFRSSHELLSAQRPDNPAIIGASASQVTPARSGDVPTMNPNGSYASLLGFTPLSEFTFNPSTFTPPGGLRDDVPTMTLSSPSNSSPSRGRPQTRAPRSSDTKRQGGLSGWDNSCSVATPSTVSLTQKKRRRSTSTSPSVAIRRPYGLSPLSLSNSSNSEATSSAHQPKRRRQFTSLTTSSRIVETEEIASDDDIDNAVDDNESDDYRPSRSPSPDLPFGHNFALEFELQGSKQRQSKADSVTASPSKKKSRRGKGKAKGSAALALAVVTQLGSKGVSGGSSEQLSLDLDDLDVMTLYQEGKTGIRKRKNNPIPLPIPVPNLNKKSRGRKVPFVADLTAGGIRRSASVMSGDNTNDEYYAGDDGENGRDNGSGGTARSRNLRKSTTPAPVVDESGCRTPSLSIRGL